MTTNKTAGQINGTDKIFSIGKTVVTDFTKFGKITIANLSVKKIRKITLSEAEGQELISIYCHDEVTPITMCIDQKINVGDSNNGGVFTNGKEIATIVKAINAKASQELNQAEALVKKLRGDIHANELLVDALSAENRKD